MSDPLAKTFARLESDIAALAKRLDSIDAPKAPEPAPDLAADVAWLAEIADRLAAVEGAQR